MPPSPEPQSQSSSQRVRRGAYPLISKGETVWTPGTLLLCLRQCLTHTHSLFSMDIDRMRERARAKGTLDRKGSKKSREREVGRQESDTFDHWSGVLRGRCPQASQPDVPVLYLASTHVMLLPAGWPISKIKGSLISRAGSLPALHWDPQTGIHQRQPLEAPAPNTGPRELMLVPHE